MQEPEKLEVETSGKKTKKTKERPPFAHRNPPDMTRVEVIKMVCTLQNKVQDQRAIIQEQKKCLKNGGDDGEGGKTYKQLYESRNGEFQEMTQERIRLTGINEKLQEDIQTLKTAAVKAENEKLLFQKDFDAQGSMLSRVEEDNKQLKAHVFRTHHHSNYAGAGSMYVRGPSPNDNVGYNNFVSPT